jgi:ABC-type transport system substrate-binding protein
MKYKVSLILTIFGVGLLLLGQINFSDEIRGKENSVYNVKSTWVIAIPGTVKSLDPQHMISLYEKNINLLTFDRLVETSSDMSISPGLLKKWDYDVSTNRYVLSLRKQVYFHDGKELTSDDVLFSIHKWIEKGSFSNDLLLSIKGASEFAKGSKNNIAGLSKIDRYTFEINLNYWVHDFILRLSMPRFVIFPNSFSGIPRKDFFEKPVGTGPYKFVEKNDEGMLYTRNNQYFKGNAKTENVKIISLKTEDAIEYFNKGVIDDLLFFDIYDVDEIKIPQSQLKVFQRKSFNSLLLISTLNSRDADDERFRKILFENISLDPLQMNCFGRSVVANSIIPKGLKGSKVVNNTIAKKGTNSLKNNESKTIYIEDGNIGKCLKTELDKQLNKFNIKISLNSLQEMYELFKKGEVDFFIEGFLFKNNDPISVLQYFNQSSNEYFLMKRLFKLNILFRKLESNISELKRIDLYRDIDDFLVGNNIVKPLSHLKTLNIMRSRVKNLTSFSEKGYFVNWKDIFIERGN